MHTRLKTSLPKLIAICACALLTAAFANARSTNAPSHHALFQQDSVKPIDLAHAPSVSWGPGLDAVLLDGDPAIPDKPYTVALRIADGRWIRPHWHPKAKQILVVSGALRVGHGAVFDTTHVETLPAGSYLNMPGEHRHFEGARGATIVIFSGIGPLTTNPATPPSK